MALMWYQERTFKSKLFTFNILNHDKVLRTARISLHIDESASHTKKTANDRLSYDTIAGHFIFNAVLSGNSISSDLHNFCYVATSCDMLERQ